jgi:hypothetical protein
MLIWTIKYISSAVGALLLPFEQPLYELKRRVYSLNYFSPFALRE